MVGKKLPANDTKRSEAWKCPVGRYSWEQGQAPCEIPSTAINGLPSESLSPPGQLLLVSLQRWHLVEGVLRHTLGGTGCPSSPHVAGPSGVSRHAGPPRTVALDSCPPPCPHRCWNVPETWWTMSACPSASGTPLEITTKTVALLMGGREGPRLPAGSQVDGFSLLSPRYEAPL